MVLAVPKGRPASLTREQMLQDLKLITQEEEQWHMLYQCLEETPPREPSASQVEELFAGTKGLDSASEAMLTMAKALEETIGKLIDLVDQLRKGP